MLIFQRSQKKLCLFPDFLQNGTLQRPGAFCVIISASKNSVLNFWGEKIIFFL